MPLMEWTPALSVDIEVIDAQHKKLFSYMNDLYDALMEKREKDILSTIFQELEDYAAVHFKFEEDYFDKFEYAGKSAHLMQHHEFIKDLSDMKTKIMANHESIEDLLGYLVDWLMRHIKGTDHQYIKCFKEHGLL